MTSLEHLKESLKMAKEEKERLNRNWWRGSAIKREEELDRINEEIKELERKISNKLADSGKAPSVPSLHEFTER